MPGQSLLRRLRLAVIALLTLGLVAVLGTVPASAADGRAAGGRGELTALYHHVLGRAPDASGLNTFGSLIDRDCRQGVLTAAYSLLVSQEANNRLTTPAAKVGSLYSALLNRVPDAPGWNAHHQSMLNGRSWSKVVTSVLASPEYAQRLNSVCAGAPTSNAMMLVGADNETMIKAFLNHGAASSLSCTATKIPGLVKKIRAGGVPIGRLAAEAGKQTSNYLGGKNACATTARYFAAAAYAAELNDRGEAVYWRSITSKGPKNWLKGGGCDFSQYFEIGTSPTEFRVFSGQQFLMICA